MPARRQWMSHRRWRPSEPATGAALRQHAALPQMAHVALLHRRASQAAVLARPIWSFLAAGAQRAQQAGTLLGACVTRDTLASLTYNPKRHI